MLSFRPKNVTTVSAWRARLESSIIEHVRSLFAVSGSRDFYQLDLALGHAISV
jgi:hypothetical protein